MADTSVPDGKRWIMNRRSLILGRILLAICVLGIFSGGCVRAMMTTEEIHSPDERIQVEFSLRDGEPHYQIIYDGQPVILPSAMGFTFRRARPMVRGFTVDDVERSGFDETWKPVWGQSGEIRNHYNEMKIHLIETRPPNRRMTVVFRVFDDGVGFRYGLPDQDNLKDFEIMSEATEFGFADDHTVWWIPADFDSYEHVYTRSRLRDMPAANTPVTMKTTGGLYISIHEASLTDYAGMTIARAKGGELDPEGGIKYKAALVPWPDGSKVKGATPFVTPWRTIHIATWPGGLIESNLILNLNDPPDPELFKDTSWIKPMKYIGIWWGMHIGRYTWHVGPRHGATTENAKRYIDFAGRHGIPGVLIEGWNTGWDRWGQEGAYDHVTPYEDFDIEEVVRYGREKGVAIIGHHETGGDIPTYDKQIDFAFRLYNELGVPAVKTGYAGKIRPVGLHHHGQWMVRHYRMVVEKAAKYGLTLDVHEPIKPTGISRTYPNMMTREGVRGMEFNAWSEGNPPEHETILPFTRMLAGPLDYTPGIFDVTYDEYKPDNRVRSTLAKQLALYVVLYSPLQMAADLIENYEANPAFEFIADVPVDWDETRVLNGEIGDFVTIARRSGESWFIGSITDENERVLTVDLSFLRPGKIYTAKIYADAPDADWETNPTAIDIREEQVDKETILTLELVRGGGQAISIMPVGIPE